MILHAQMFLPYPLTKLIKRVNENGSFDLFTLSYRRITNVNLSTRLESYR